MRETSILSDVRERNKSLRDVSYRYDYPERLDLRPGTRKHDRLLAKILDRAQLSASTMLSRHKSWMGIDNMLTAYVAPDDEEQVIKTEDPRKPVSVVIPSSFANLETILTFLMATFLDNPIFKLQGTGPEDTIGTALLEKKIELDSIKAQMALNLYIQWRDSLAYGLGIIYPHWVVEMGMREVQVPTGFFSTFLGAFRTTGSTTEEEEYPIYEGSKLCNISPYQYLPDPNVSPHRVQEGEFVGWVERTNRLALRSLERSHPDMFFNAKYLDHIEGGQSQVFSHDGVQADPRARFDTLPYVTNVVDKICMCVNLIPKEWGLSKKDYPEKWFFAVAADLVILAARPLKLRHGKFPTIVCAPDFTGYEASPISRMEMLNDLAVTINWIASSRITAVRKSLHDMFVVDPSIIHMPDLLRPQPGKYIRLRRSVWGKGAINQAIQQFPVSDVTARHVQDVGFLMEIMQRVSGAMDVVSGIMKSSAERTSAAEVQTAKAGALSRLEKIARLIQVMSQQELALQLAFNTQQYMSSESYVRATGRYQEDLMREYGVGPGDPVPVDPSKINVAFDVVPTEISMQGAEFASVWMELYRIASGNPELMQRLDMVRVFKHIARLMGARNINEFDRKEMQVMPDQQVAAQAQAGNLVPIGGQGGGY